MKPSSIIFILAVAVFSSIFIYGQNFIPAVRVNGEVLSYADYFKNLDGLLRFNSLQPEPISNLDMERVAINSFLEDVFMRQELSRRGKGEADVDKFVYATVKEEDLANLSQATGQLYGWSVADFKKFVLYPQARRIILSQEFEKEKADPAAWLEKSVNEAKISIYLPRWKWGDGEVRRRY